ncbi:hypothetical protein FHW58_003405 [Duganella sp. 1224]|uniref:hypothetical protein n=1 Tax=Duganella sp. 1224 TaxID=2587052 RepID=UPI0015CE1F89|nr:hypothetical protein [Duganella sp. 1224]NYE62190.1 hypothetical protein [Duganella sp. 1224]
MSFTTEESDEVAKPAPVPANPARGGSYARDPDTGALELLVEPPKPAPKKQSTEE